MRVAFGRVRRKSRITRMTQILRKFAVKSTTHAHSGQIGVTNPSHKEFKQIGVLNPKLCTPILAHKFYQYTEMWYTATNRNSDMRVKNHVPND